MVDSRWMSRQIFRTVLSLRSSCSTMNSAPKTVPSYMLRWNAQRRMERQGAAFAFADIVPVSAQSGENIARLEEVFLRHLPEGQPLYPQDYLTDQPERFFVAELVREQVLLHTHAELPFSSAVVVDRFEEANEKGLMRFFCSILVERESQKPIIVGKGGEMIKRIGTAARHELERFFDARVFLDLRVKTSPDWRENERFLDELGLRGR